MSEETEFLAALAAAPADNCVRQVYADWLDERGRPEGTFLRAECELAAIPIGQAEWHEAFAHVQAVGRGLRREWFAVAARHPMEYWLAAATRSAWARLEDWCQRHHPRLLGVLRPGASAAAIDAVEQAVGQPLPPDLRASLALHNGSERFLFGSDLLSADDLIDQWQGWRGLESMNDDFGDRLKSYPEGAIALAYTIPGWIPLTQDGGGNHLGVDLAPGPAGTVGQVINFGRDEESKGVLASGWAEFLADFATFLESGAVKGFSAAPSDWGEACRAALGGNEHYHDVLRKRRQQGNWPPKK